MSPKLRNNTPLKECDPSTPSKNTRSNRKLEPLIPRLNLSAQLALTHSKRPRVSPKSKPASPKNSKPASPKNRKSATPTESLILSGRLLRSATKKRSPKGSQVKKTPAKGKLAKSTPAKKTPEKDTPVKETPVELSIYQKYKHALSTTIKSKLVFRESETNEIQSFLEEHLSKKTSSSIYISGPPGTGKTASVTAILDSLKEKYKFKTLFFNGMAFTSSTNFFKKLLQDLNDGDHTTKDLTPQIVKALSRPGGQRCVLVLDEIDILDSRHQEMLYTIFNLPMYKSTKVIIVGIANSLDFTSKKLVRYHSLNINPMKEVSFQPYDPEKLTGVLRSRISELAGRPLFQPAAIDFCAKKVASLSGDARKALEILRRSVELVEQEVLNSSKSFGALKEQNNQEVCQQAEVKQVGIGHVAKILNQVYSDKFAEATDDDYNFPIQQKIVLCMILLMARDGNRNPELGKCYDRLIRIDKDRSLNLEISTAGIFLDMCETLEGKSFIAIQRSKDLRCAKLSLAISEEEAKELLKANAVTRSILNS